MKIINLFFLTLDINDRLLNNCMLDSRASTNVMTKKVMEQLNLIISRPYNNICSMDFKRVEVLGVVKDLQVSFVDYPYRIITMDIAVKMHQMYEECFSTESLQLL